MKIDDAAARLEALGNPTRLRIYRTLVRAGDAGSSVGKLQSKLDLAGSTLSHHLKALIATGSRRAGAAGYDADLPGELRRHARHRRFPRGRMLCRSPACGAIAQPEKAA